MNVCSTYVIVLADPIEKLFKKFNFFSTRFYIKLLKNEPEISPEDVLSFTDAINIHDIDYCSVIH